MKILIVEDEKPAAERLERMVIKCKPDAEIAGKTDSITTTVKWLENNECPDLILLDIQLADGLSFTIFERIKIPCPVIFTTAYDEYTLKAFELNSIDYLLKPIDKEKLKISLEKFDHLKSYFAQEKYDETFKSFIHQLKTGNAYKNRFLIHKTDSLLVINTEDIACFITEDKYVLVVTNDNKKNIVPFTLDTLEKQLDPKQFFRISRQAIISMKAIKKIHTYFNYQLKIDLVISTETEMVVSKQRTQAFKIWLDS